MDHFFVVVVMLSIHPGLLIPISLVWPWLCPCFGVAVLQMQQMRSGSPSLRSYVLYRAMYSAMRSRIALLDQDQQEWVSTSVCRDGKPWLLPWRGEVLWWEARQCVVSTTHMHHKGGSHLTSVWLAASPKEQADETWLQEFSKKITTSWDFTAIHVNKNNLEGVKRDIVCISPSSLSSKIF